MITLIPLLFSMLVGFLMISPLIKNSRLPHRHFYALTLSTPIGFGLLSYILFWSYVLGGRYGKIVSVILVVTTTALLAIIYFRRHDPREWIRNLSNLSSGRNMLESAFANSLSKCKRGWFLVLLTSVSFGIFLYFLIQSLQYFAAFSLMNVNGGWDAMYVWNMKAKFCVRAPEEWRRIFLSVMNSYHPEYPFLLPGAVAWGWIMAGKEFLAWPPMVALSFYLSAAAIIIWYLRASTSMGVALFGAAFFLINPFYRFWSVVQYADVPLVFFIAASATTLVWAARNSDRRLFLVAGLLSGFTAWTKNEGLFYVLWIGVTAALVLVLNRELTVKQKIDYAVRFSLGLIPPLLAALYIVFFLAQSGDFVGSGRHFSDYWSLMFSSWEKTKMILMSFKSFMLNLKEWNRLWVFFGIAAFYGILFARRRLALHYSWILIFLVLMIEFGYFIIIHLSRYDLKFQIETALARLLLHAGILALIFTFEIFAPKQETLSGK